ncbi:MAG: hypothetical protein ACPGU4_14210 [Flavobacteriales bacterium]
MKTLIKLLSLSALPFLIACEGNTDYSWVVKNDSSQTISINGTGLVMPDTINTEISPNSELEVGTFSQRGGNSSVQDPDNYFGNVFITNADGDTATKNFLVQSNWTSDIEQRSKVPSDYQHHYRFSITDSDF